MKTHPTKDDKKSFPTTNGFTLVEVSIVIVIIGLLVGGILVGKDLIAASESRGQITQIQSYQAAVKSFAVKYNALPGDMNTTDAAAFGLSSTNIVNPVYWKPNNGIIDCCNPEGEPNLFWQQLSDAGLIPGKYNTLQLYNNGNTSVYGANVAYYVPRATIGGNASYVYVWANGPTCCGVYAKNGKNYFGIGTIASFLYGANWMTASASLTPAQSSAIDSKIDDGLPQSGKVQAMGATGSFDGARYSGAFGFTPSGGPTTAATPGSSTTCYDNNNTGGSRQQYSMGQNDGANITCMLSFDF